MKLLANYVDRGVRFEHLVRAASRLEQIPRFCVALLYFVDGSLASIQLDP